MQISGKQCKTARGLLKWNVRELEFRSTVRVRLIESFEKGLKPLPPSQRELLFKTFKKEGIVFLDYGEVWLDESAKEDHIRKVSQQTHEVHYIDADSLLGIHDLQYRQARTSSAEANYDSPTLD
jgi:hypothetical protein